MTEAQIHNAVVDMLTRFAVPGCMWLHIPNGERRDAVTGAKLKRMGTRAGAADFLVIVGGRVMWLEIKTRDGKHSAAQIQFAAEADQAGASYRTARSTGDALIALRSFGALRNVQVAA